MIALLLLSTLWLPSVTQTQPFTVWNLDYMAGWSPVQTWMTKDKLFVNCSSQTPPIANPSNTQRIYYLDVRDDLSQSVSRVFEFGDSTPVGVDSDGELVTKSSDSLRNLKGRLKSDWSAQPEGEWPYQLFEGIVVVMTDRGVIVDAKRAFEIKPLREQSNWLPALDMMDGNIVVAENDQNTAMCRVFTIAGVCSLERKLIWRWGASATLHSWIIGVAFLNSDHVVALFDEDTVQGGDGQQVPVVRMYDEPIDGARKVTRIVAGLVSLQSGTIDPIAVFEVAVPRVGEFPFWINRRLAVSRKRKFLSLLYERKVAWVRIQE